VVPDTNSAVLRRYIGRRFERLRVRRGLSREQAADRLERSRVTIGRIEDGHESVRYRDIDVKAMLDIYQATPEERALMLALTAETRNGKRKGWWHDYTETALPEWFGLYVTLEDSAERISQYESELIPGLLQTPEYAAELVRIESGGTASESDTERRVRVRQERQGVLTRPRAPRLDVILNEAVIRRPFGGNAVMAAQLAHVMEVTQRANVTVRIVPFSVGGHAGAGAGAFAILDFPEDPRTGELLEPPLAYLDTMTAGMYLQKPEEVETYRRAWEDLRKKALDTEASKNLINKAMEGYGA
jgi:transcriptional regulator with XRE-family HTH domain